MNQNGNYLLDTNIVIGMLTGDTVIQEKMQNGNNLFLASPTVGELYYGAQKSNKVTENLHRINTFVEEHIFPSCDLETAQWYGIIKNQLRRKGRPIPNNDLWIAAIALQYDLILVTRDAHFDEVESLQTEYWYGLHQQQIWILDIAGDCLQELRCGCAVYDTMIER